MEIQPEYRTFKSILKSFSSLKDWHALRTHALSQLDWTTSRQRAESKNFLGAIPWWSYSCTHFLDQVVPTDATILEIGGGASSIWWLERGNSVTTFESDYAWASHIRDQTKSFGGRHKLFSFESLSEISIKLDGQIFDVTVNDGSVDRNISSQILLEHQNSNGFMVWDNSDRVEYESGLAELKLNNWKPLEFFGLGPINAFASQTTIFLKGSISTRGRQPEFKTVIY